MLAQVSLSTNFTNVLPLEFALQSLRGGLYADGTQAEASHIGGFVAPGQPLNGWRERTQIAQFRLGPVTVRDRACENNRIHGYRRCHAGVSPGTRKCRVTPRAMPRGRDIVPNTMTLRLVAGSENRLCVTIHINNSSGAHCVCHS